MSLTNKEKYTKIYNEVNSHKEKLGTDAEADIKRNQLDIFIQAVGEEIISIKKRKDISEKVKKKAIALILDRSESLWNNQIKTKYSAEKKLSREKMKIDREKLKAYFSQEIDNLKADILAGNNLIIENKYLDNSSFGDGIKGKIEESQEWDSAKLTEKIKEIKLSGEVTSESLDELFEDILSHAKKEDIPGIKARIAEIKTKPIYTEGFSLNGINKKLNGYVETINKNNKPPFTLKFDFSNSINPINNNGGLKEVTFNTKEEALRAIYKMKLIFDETAEFNLTSFIMGGIGNFALGLIKAPYDYMWRPLGTILYNLGKPLASSEEALWGLGFTYLGLGGLGYVMLKRKLETANSGIDKSNIESLKQEIEKMRDRYLDLDMKEEAQNLDKLHKKISSINFEESKNGTKDFYRLMKTVYRELNAFRGTPIGDTVRMGAGYIGSALDQRDTKPKFTNLEGKYTISSTLKGLASLYVYPVKLTSTIVNKGPNWWKLWYTKSEAILDYETEFKATNQKFDLIWDKIDNQISGLDSDEKEELKKEILKKYKSDVWTAKNDPLIKIKINPKLIGPEEKIALFNKLETILHAEGKTKVIKSWKDFWINFKNIDSGKKDLIKDFVKTLNPVEGLGRITADTITNHLKNKPLVNIPTTFAEDIQKEIDKINENAKAYMKNLPEILKAKNEFNDFIKYYPEIDEKTEKEILELNKNISGTISGKETKNKVIENINNKLGTSLTENDIKNFIKDNDIEHNIANEIKFSKYTSQATNILDRMLAKGEITTNEHIDRISKIQNLFSIKTRTFWQAHLGLTIDNIIETGNDSYTSKYSDVINFKNNPNNGGGSIDNYFIEKEKIINKRDIFLEELKNKTPDELKLIFDEHTFENELRKMNLELVSLNATQEREFKDLIKDLHKGGRDAQRAKDEFIKKIEKLKKVK